MTPCCAKPLLYPIGTAACDVSSIERIDWFQCFRCKAQVSDVVMKADVKHDLQPVRPNETPVCHNRECLFVGIAQESNGETQLSVTIWKCRTCSEERRVLRG